MPTLVGYVRTLSAEVVGHMKNGGELRAKLMNPARSFAAECQQHASVAFANASLTDALRVTDRNRKLACQATPTENVARFSRPSDLTRDASQA